MPSKFDQDKINEILKEGSKGKPDDKSWVEQVAPERVDQGSNEKSMDGAGKQPEWAESIGKTSQGRYETEPDKDGNQEPDKNKELEEKSKEQNEKDKDD